MKSQTSYIKENNQIIASAYVNIDESTIQANANENLSFPVRSDSDNFELDSIEISSSEYESPAEAAIADEIHSADGYSKLTPEQLKAFNAHVLGTHLASELTSIALHYMMEHDSEPENPLHMTFVQSFDNLNYGVSGFNGIEQYDHKRVYDPSDRYIEAVLYEYLVRCRNVFKTYNPDDLVLDFDRGNDGGYVLICDYYRDIHDDNRMVQNIVIAQLYM